MMVALYKGEDSRSDPNNYRMITLMPVVAKLFEKVLDDRIRKWGERMGLLSDLQGGFREERCTVDQLFILQEITAHRSEKNLSSFLTFVDVRKAYDRVWRPGLWFKLGQVGLGSRICKMIRTMYDKVVRKILVNGRMTDEFEVHAGVPQGAVLSPALYAIYIDGLHKALREAGLGVRIYGVLVPLLLYADDLVLLARSIEDMMAMHAVVADYARKWRFEINHRKTKLVVTGAAGVMADRQAVRNQSWEFAGGVVELVDEYKYLGAEVGKTRGKWNSMLERIWQKASAGANLTLWRGGGAAGLRAKSFVTLWKAEVRPVLEYGAEVWDGDGVAQAWVDKLEKLQYSFGKAVLGIKGNAAAAGIRAELGLPSLELRRRKCKLQHL